MATAKDREAYISELEGRIREWVDRIDQLAARAQAVQTEGRLEYPNRLDDLRGKGAAARAGLEALREASGEAVEDARIAAERAWSSLKDAVEDVEGQAA
jgi:hypothetical protein